MKTISVSSAALLAALVVAPVLQAHADQTPGWYVGAGVGGSQTEDSRIGNRPNASEAYFNPGYDLNGNFGYSWTNGLRLEGELWHSRAEIDAVHGAQTSSGHLSNTNVFANAYYDFHNSSRYTPYIGIGVGGAFVDADNIKTLTDGNRLDGQNLELAYQAIGGVAAQLDDNWALTADYRYVATPDIKAHTTSGRGAYYENASHNIVLGVRYSLNPPVEKVVADVAPPARPVSHTVAKPVVAPVPQSFMVFFDFNKSVLTPEAKRILASAAQEFKRGGYVKIVVTGHTDTVGSIGYNQKLSQRRAAAVKSELAALGVDTKIVQAVGAGKNGLLVPTADGVREAQNRRAEIVLDKQ